MKVDNYQENQRTPESEQLPKGLALTEYHPVYVVCEKVPQQCTQVAAMDFFQNVIANVHRSATDFPLFLNQRSAVKYGRMLGSNTVIFKAYVPGSAVVGCSDGLILKKGYINKSNIANGFVIHNSQALYFDNFYFNKGSVSDHRKENSIEHE